MPEEVQNANIIISSAEDTGPQIKIRDHTRRTFSFFKTKKDGDQTAAYKSYQHFKIGDPVEISYKEVPYKEGMIKNILNLRPASGPVESAPAPRRGFTQSRGGPDREYWEQREATRQNSILLQVAFKAAVSLEAARLEAGGEEDRDRLFRNTLEFYDLMADQLGDGGIGNLANNQVENKSQANEAGQEYAQEPVEL